MHATVFAIEAHGTQPRRESGLPYVIHVARTARTVSTFFDHLHKSFVASKLENPDPAKPVVDCDLTEEDAVVIALLHDTIEDTRVQFGDILTRFGEKIATYVSALTSNKEEIAKMGKTTYLIKKMQTVNLETRFLKLCDRLDNVKDYAKSVDRDRAQAYCRQTIALLASLPEDTQVKLWELIEVIVGKCIDIVDVWNSGEQSCVERVVDFMGGEYHISMLPFLDRFWVHW